MNKHDYCTMDSGTIFNTIVGVASSLGVVSLGWNIINLLRSESGFAKLGLECSSDSKSDENYIISKTSLENTSRRPIKVISAVLLLVDQSVSFEEGINIVMEEIDVEEQFVSFEEGINIVMEEVNKTKP